MIEYVKCELCGADNTKVILRAKYRSCIEKIFFNIVKCQECGLVYLNPRPDNEEIKKYYPPSYHSRAQKGVVDIEKTKIWGIPWREAMDRKVKPILKYKNEGSILDIGCGDGSLLKYMKELGWQSYGIDMNEGSSRYAREVLGLDVLCGRLEETDYPQEFFDVIILFHVMEHLNNPSEALKRIYSLLKKDGFLFIEVPNFNSFEARVFRSKWVGIAAPVHLYHFTPRTLEKMLWNCGFESVESGFIPEQTRYVAGYSESIRNCLIDWGLYPERKENAGFGEGAESNETSDSSWESTLHSLEYRIFYPVSRFMDKIGFGLNLMVAAKKCLNYNGLSKKTEII